MHTDRDTSCCTGVLPAESVTHTWCTLAYAGILKGRFRILKLPFECHDMNSIDNVFFTCCVLHNQIQTYKKFDKVWLDEMDWTGRGGLFGNNHIGRRQCGAGANRTSYMVRAHTDYSGSGVREVENEDGEGDVCEADLWKELGETLARHYEREKNAGNLLWPKSQRACALRVD